MNELVVLIVEDNEETAKTLVKTLQESFDGIETFVEKQFNEALSRLDRKSQYDVLILDLYEGDPQTTNLAGQPIWEHIWGEMFIPIVIYTAGDINLEPEPPDDHPFIILLQKGAGSDVAVVNSIQTFKPYILAMRNVMEEFQVAIHTVLKGNSPKIWELAAEEVDQRSEILVRSTRRRLAAMMDMKTLLGEEEMKGWELYVFPPLENNLLSGDILRKGEGDPLDPSSFRLVLSPSCDLVVQRGGKIKLNQALTSTCETLDRYLECVRSQGKINATDLIDKLPGFLSQPHIGGYVPMPAMKGVIPSMAANLRELEIIELEEIGLNESDPKTFIRLASIDSPFREQLIWAYMTIAGRPGVPNRDLTEWAKQIAPT